MNCNRSLNERGTTLIEALVALTLFALMAAAVSNLLVGHMRAEASNVLMTTAIALAERELEDLRALDYNAIAARTTTQAVDGLSYQVATSVLADSPATGMKSITTIVSWTEPDGARSYTLNALYTAVKR